MLIIACEKNHKETVEMLLRMPNNDLNIKKKLCFVLKSYIMTLIGVV